LLLFSHRYLTDTVFDLDLSIFFRKKKRMKEVGWIQPASISFRSLSRTTSGPLRLRRVSEVLALLFFSY
jgi:hypothetical protein